MFNRMKQVNDYVCSLEQARELKELGLIQNSIFYWTAFEHRKDYVLATRKDVGGGYEYRFCESVRLEPNDEPYQGISAFTSGELGVALPVSFKHEGHTFVLHSTSDLYFLRNEIVGERRFINYYKAHENGEYGYGCGWIIPINDEVIKRPTDAESKADLLIHLLKNKFINIEDVNKRLQ
jgi:hypothetical protein